VLSLGTGQNASNWLLKGKSRRGKGGCGPGGNPPLAPCSSSGKLLPLWLPIQDLPQGLRYRVHAGLLSVGFSAEVQVQLDREGAVPREGGPAEVVVPEKQGGLPVEPPGYTVTERRVGVVPPQVVHRQPKLFRELRHAPVPGEEEPSVVRQERLPAAVVVTSRKPTQGGGRAGEGECLPRERVGYVLSRSREGEAVASELPGPPGVVDADGVEGEKPKRAFSGMPSFALPLQGYRSFGFPAAVR